MVCDDQALHESKEQGFPSLRSEGDSSLPSVADQLRKLHEGHGAGADANALAGPVGRNGGVLPRELLLDHSGRAGEAPRLLQEGGDRFQGNDRSGGGALARTADAEFGTASGRERLSAEYAGGKDRSPVDVADFQRGEIAPARTGEAPRYPAGTAMGAP